MCELLAVCSARLQQVNDILREFYSHSVTQPNGWGLAVLDENGASVEKEPVRAIDSGYLDFRLKSRVRAKDIIAHIRLATVGKQKYENCHPFVRRDICGRCWTLAHNGTVFSAPQLEQYHGRQEGQTDSERILMYLLDHINEEQSHNGLPLDAERRFAIIDRVICELAPKNKLNILIFDGEVMYAHTNYAHTLHVYRTADTATLATKPVGDVERWHELRLNKLLAYKDGRLLFTGTDHGHEYFDNEADRRLIALGMAQGK